MSIPPKKPPAEPILPFEPDDDAAARPEEPILHPAFDECDDQSLLELDAAYWDALLIDDEDAGLPEAGDFWIDEDAA
jgi:hypothetical protein